MSNELKGPDLSVTAGYAAYVAAKAANVAAAPGAAKRAASSVMLAALKTCLTQAGRPDLAAKLPSM